MHRLVGATKWSNLVFKRGLSRRDALVRWQQSWVDGGRELITTGEIVQLNTQLQGVARWRFTDGWPCKWELSDFDATKSELSMETLEIAHHGLRFSG